MSITIEKNWWQPLSREEKIWVYIIVGWALILLAMMPLGHMYGNQNVSSESYRVTPERYKKTTDAFIKAHQRKDANGKRIFKSGRAVVDAVSGPNKDNFLIATSWRFDPILVLKKGETYRIHMSSDFYQHGFSLQPQNLNFQIMPDYDFVITLTPKKTGVFNIICNEYCFYANKTQGHDTMVGQMIVEN